MIQPDLLARIKAAGAAGVTRATLCAELGVTVATVQGKVGKLRALSLIVEQAPAHLNGSRQDCLIWAAEFAPAVVPVIVPPPKPNRNKFDKSALELVRASGSVGVTWQQVAQALEVVKKTAQDKLQALVNSGAVVSQRIGNGRSAAAKAYYAAGMEPKKPEKKPKPAPKPITIRKEPKPKKASAPQGPAILPAGLSVTICPNFIGDRWSVQKPTVSNLNPDECRQWAKYR